MSEILSREQIDQLLSAGGFSEGNETAGATPAPAPAGAYQAFGKTLDLFCEQLMSVLKTVLNRTVNAQRISCDSADANSIKRELKGEPLCIALPFKSGLNCEAYLFVKKSDAAVLGDLMMMGEGNVDYKPEHDDAIVELSSQILSSFALALTSDTGVQVAAAPAKMSEYSLDTMPPGELGMAVATLAVEGKPESRIALVASDAFGALLEDRSGLDESPQEQGAGEGAAGFTPVNFEAGADFSGGTKGAPGKGASAAVKQGNIDMLLDVDLDVSIELGSSNLSIKRILELAPGSIVELNRMAGEPVDLMVNDKVIAKGEVVVIDENFGIRILSLISPEERIKSLR